MQDVIIIGAGAAGQAAVVKAKNLGLNFLVVAKEIVNLEHYRASEFVDLQKIAQLFKKEILQTEVKKAEVLRLEKNVVSFSVETGAGEIFYAHSIIIASGKGNFGFETLTEKNQNNQIKINSYLQTSIPGIFAAGEASESLGGDLALLTADGIRAAISAQTFLKQKSQLKTD